MTRRACLALPASALTAAIPVDRPFRVGPLEILIRHLSGKTYVSARMIPAPLEETVALISLSHRTSTLELKVTDAVVVLQQSTLFTGARQGGLPFAPAAIFLIRAQILSIVSTHVYDELAALISGESDRAATPTNGRALRPHFLAC